MKQLNSDKWSDLSVGENNPLSKYTLNNTTYGPSSCETELDVRVSSDLRPRTHCITARNRLEDLCLNFWKCYEP